MTLRLILVVCLMVTSTSAVIAQGPRPERPYRGLFRGGAQDQLGGSALTLDLSLGGGYDDNVFADAVGGTVTDTATWDSGVFGRVTAALTYTKETERASMGATLATDARYFPDFETEFYGAHTASIGGELPLGRATRLRADQVISYQPFLTLELFPSLSTPGVGISEPAAQENATPFDESILYLTSVELSQQTSRRGELTFSYDHELDDFADTSDFRRQAVLGRYTHEISRGLGVRLGYGYSVGSFSGQRDQDQLRGHIIDVGIDYDKALSLSRRTTLSFTTGTSAVSTLDGTRYGVIGDVHLNHEIGRTWNTSLAYARNVTFVRTFQEPFFSDSVGAEISGLVTRRLEFDLTGAATFGTVGSGGGEDGFTTYGGSTSLTYGMTRHLALVATYAYYRHSFESGVTLPTGLSPEADRQSAALALAMWFPLYQRFRSQ